MLEACNLGPHKRHGCGECNGKGVCGREGIYEVMKMNAELRQMTKGALAEGIHTTALKGGMWDSRDTPPAAVGNISVEEMLQVVSGQE